MTSPSLLDDIRGFYLEHFRRVIKEKRRVPGAKIITEPAWRLKNGVAGRQGPWNLPRRKDVIIRSPTVNGSFQIKTERALQFRPMTFAWGRGLTVSVGPFRWEECPIKVLGMPADDQLLPLVDWYDRWFDEFDSKGPLKKEFQEVVHFLEAPERKGGSTELVIDFGSAPKAAYEELLDAFDQIGSTEVAIGQVDQIAD
jgi:hypothetical protein